MEPWILTLKRTVLSGFEFRYLASVSCAVAGCHRDVATNVWSHVSERRPHGVDSSLDPPLRGPPVRGPKCQTVESSVVDSFVSRPAPASKPLMAARSLCLVTRGCLVYCCARKRLRFHCGPSFLSHRDHVCDSAERTVWDFSAMNRGGLRQTRGSLRKDQRTRLSGSGR